MNQIAKTEVTLPHSIDFNLIGKCNLRCPFCWGPEHNVSAMNTRTAMQIIDFVYSQGTKVIVFTGGEPTLIPDLPLILERAKSHGMKTVLSSNGLLFQKRMDEIAPLLDWVAFPLDASDPSINRIMRKGKFNQMDAVIGSMTDLNKKYPQVGIKLGTVVSRLNKGHVTDIPQFLPQAAKPDMWKLYQVSPINYGKQNFDALRVSDENFALIEDEARANAARANIAFSVSRNSERNGKYLFIYPDGEIRVIDNGDERAIGNIITEPKAILEKWKYFVNEDRLESNEAVTYPMHPEAKRALGSTSPSPQ